MLPEAMEIPASQCESFGSITYSDTYKGLETSTTSTTYAEGYNLLIGKYVSVMDGQSKFYVVEATSESAKIIDATYGPVNPSGEIEAILASTEDDYGTSYYYRGAVENNYLVFAGMCWRIVRVDGLGNTKLTLYNYNPTGASNPCAANLDGDSMAFARLMAGDTNSYTSVFNVNGKQNAYIGYMYGTPGSSTYDSEHANTTDSTILSNLKGWYDRVFTSAQKEMLADVIWCNDKRVVSDTSYDPLNTITNVLGTGIGRDKTYYQASQRLITYNSITGKYDTSEASPSLKCGESKEDNKISKFTASTSTDGGYGNGALNGYKIGLLTADELAFAGSTTNTNLPNYPYYLIKNTNHWYWTMSPNNFVVNGELAYIWGVSGMGFLTYDAVISDGLCLRPSVSLKSTASISSGTGTQENPFIVS